MSNLTKAKRGSRPVLDIKITQSWDGHGLAPEHHVTLTLHKEGEHMHLQFKSPFYKNPPPDSPVGSTPELWEHEVVEIFFARGEHYLECEFGPYGHYLLLELNGVRQVLHEGMSVNYTALIMGDIWQGEARIPLAYFPPEPWTYNAYAIFEAQGEKQYIALFPADESVKEPDFHRLEFFRKFEP